MPMDGSGAVLPECDQGQDEHDQPNGQATDEIWGQLRHLIDSSG